MFTLRRWWDKNALKAGLIFLAIGTAWGIRQTNGGLIDEAYQVITRPFQSPSTQKQIENAYVLELQQRVIELENQNQKLRELVDYEEGSSLDTTTLAAVIGRSADLWWQQVTVNKGSRDGVNVGDVATGPGGLVGRIVNVTPNTARILLLSDPTSQIGAKVSRSRSTGYIRGETGSQATMQFFEKIPDVRPGDVLVTSSFSRLFPQDIPIGRVASIDRGTSPAPEAVIQLSVPISNLEWVAIHPYEPKLDVDAAPAQIVTDDNP
ncbi:MAG: rod shape-determining protein MreC [Phormidesmis priestleyi Ana]|uniref:Cell shape-determining protein MreC n=1 Tax=Phormidesmis priestleyi Ana TaxID=1666911 RepID=A0A0P8DKW3_9CYAN|nr:MAG: rod shape-determining protein MreC [Phormidesmis priestleyi Ana]